MSRTITRNVRTHGTRAGYVHGCRCVPCHEANKRYAWERDHPGEVYTMGDFSHDDAIDTILEVLHAV